MQIKTYSKYFRSKILALITVLFLFLDLGDLGDDAIVVLEEAVGVGAEETVTGMVNIYLHFL